MGHNERAEWRRRIHAVIVDPAALPASEDALAHVNHKLHKMWSIIGIMEEWMVDIDTALADLGSAIQGVSARVQSTQATLQAEITSLQQAGTDTTKLQEVADALEQHVSELDAIDPSSTAGTTDPTSGDTGATGPTTPPPSTTGDGGTAAPALYTFSGDTNSGDQNGASAAGWTVADVVTSGGMTLYTTTEATFDTTAWVLYTGATQPAPSAGQAAPASS